VIVSRFEDLVQALVGAQMGHLAEPLQDASPEALVAASRGSRRGVVPAAPTPWMDGDAIRTAANGDVEDYQAPAEVLLRAAQARRRAGEPLHGAVLIGQGTRSAGPNAAIEARAGAGRPQQTFQLGNLRYNVWVDESGKRHVRAFKAGPGARRRLM
jgi:hypothetical protein